MRYADIPSNIQRYIKLSEEDFNACPESAQQIFYSQAAEHALYWHEHDSIPPQQEIDLSAWKWHDGYYTRSFLSQYYQDYIYRGRTEHPLIVTSENIHTFFEMMNEIAREHEPVEENNSWRSYEITLITSHGHINSSLGSLLHAIITNIETYEDDELSISEVIIRYTSTYNRIFATRYLQAGNGEGIPIPQKNGFWLLDLFPSKCLCIINCFILWKWYTSGKLSTIQHHYIQFDHERKALREKILSSSISIDTLLQISPHPYKVSFSEEDDISPADTISSCIYHYENGHVYLLIHESYVENMSYIYLKSQSTFIQRINRKNIPAFTTEINVLDIESFRSSVDNNNTFVHIPLMIGHIYKNKYECFKGDNCLSDYLVALTSQMDADTVIWAHNGGRYDFHLLLEDLMKIADSSFKNPIELLDIHGKYIQMTVKLSNGFKLYFRDSCSLIPASLNQLAKDFGLDGKLEDENIDIVNVDRQELISNALYEKYNEQDCVLLKQILQIYASQCIDAFGIDPLNHPSASSYGKRVFYSQYYDENKYPLYTLPKQVHAFIKSSYGGGRCEVFYRGVTRDSLYYYDINSSYPHAGCLPLPYGKPIYHQDLNRIKDIYRFLQNHPGFYRVKVKQCGKGKPIHGIMHEGKFIFPTFNNSSPSIVLFSEEIKYGLTLGWNYMLISGYEFKLEKWARTFFEKLYENKLKAKKANNKALEYSYKITANSSYGFFGYDKYNRHVSKIYSKDQIGHVKCLEYNGKASFFEYDDKLFVYENTNILLNDVNLAVASAITSYGRIHLHSLMTAIENQRGQVYYVDTDSLITNLRIEDTPSLSYLIGEELGQLKSELKPHDRIIKSVFVSSKLYGFETQYGHVESHAKGVHQDKKELLVNLETLLSLNVTFDVSSMFIGRTIKTKGNLNVYDKRVSKVLSGKYTKRRILDTGHTVELVF